MKFVDIKNSLERITKKLFSPKTVAALGVAAAIFQVAMALEEMRNSLSENQKDDDC